MNEVAEKEKKICKKDSMFDRKKKGTTEENAGCVYFYLGKNNDAVLYFGSEEKSILTFWLTRMSFENYMFTSISIQKNYFFIWKQAVIVRKKN